MPILLALGLLAFLGIDSVRIVAPAWRDDMVARIGEGRYKGIDSLIAAAGLVAIVWGYAGARMQPTVLWVPPVWSKHLAPLLMLPVFILFAAAGRRGHIRRKIAHPMLTAVGLWSVAHLVANGTLADVMLFGGFLVWAVADRLSVAGRPAPSTAIDAPSLRADAIAVAGGLAVYLAIVLWLHVWWLGVSPLPG
jgi:uncharacterized membrane protein